MEDELLIKNLFSLEETSAEGLLENFDYPWEALGHISDFILQLGPSLPQEKYDRPKADVWIAKSAKVMDSACIAGPCIIGENTEVRHCAFIRGKALIGDNCVVGNSSELKNVILFNNVHVPHYNYVGDSILGTYAHMGAGSITSNVKSDNANVIIKNGDKKIETGIRKIGAFIGDHVEIGCGSVLNPGTVIGKSTNIYPLSSVRGYVPQESIYKSNGEIVKKR